MSQVHTLTPLVTLLSENALMGSLNVKIDSPRVDNAISLPSKLGTFALMSKRKRASG